MVELPSMMAAIPVSRGDRIRAIGGVGGGYGSPFERSPAQVLDDVLDGYLSREDAARSFGVVITGDGRVDEAATRRLRAA